jgi:hypothetical protein
MQADVHRQKALAKQKSKRMYRAGISGTQEAANELVGTARETAFSACTFLRSTLSTVLHFARCLTQMCHCKRAAITGVHHN